MTTSFCIVEDIVHNSQNPDKLPKTKGESSSNCLSETRQQNGGKGENEEKCVQESMDPYQVEMENEATLMKDDKENVDPNMLLTVEIYKECDWIEEICISQGESDVVMKDEEICISQGEQQTEVRSSKINCAA